VLVDPWIRRSTGPDWRDHTGYLGSEIDGGFAELCVVPADNVFTVESTRTDVELATLACSWSTAGNMLARVELTAGQRIAITGASGGVGRALVQLAKLRGAVVTAIAAAAKAPAVVALGADHVVARESSDVPQVAGQDGGPFDVVADVVGGADVPGWLRSLRRGGRYVCAGAIAGPMVDLDLRVMYLNDLELIGATACPPPVFAELVELIESGSVQPLVAATYPLERIHEAQDAFDATQHVGSIVITIQ
jgi:NADPH:quinone reductase-like Zn-dependent oxidoreductase